MPLTLCNMPLNTQICILEMGMNNKGEIKKEIYSWKFNYVVLIG